MNSNTAKLMRTNNAIYKALWRFIIGYRSFFKKCRADKRALSALQSLYWKKTRLFMDSGGLLQQSCGLLEIGVVGRMSVALSAVWNGCSIIIRRKALRFSTLRTQDPAFHNEPSFIGKKLSYTMKRLFFLRYK